MLKFQFNLYQSTGGYIYLYDRVTRKSTIKEYLAGLSEIDNNITSTDIFKFGLADGSPIADTIVSVSRAIDKTALTLSTVAKIGVQVASPVVLPIAYLVSLCEAVLRELWWKLGWDDLSTTFPIPPPFGCILSLVHPVYSSIALTKYPILATLNKIRIAGIHIQQFLSKCIRDGLYVHLLKDSRVRFLGVNFLMTPVYSSTGIIEGTQMKRILNDKSYARLLALQILYFRYVECEQKITDFINEMNETKTAVQLNQTTRDNIKKNLSPSFLDVLKNSISVSRTENYVKNAGLISSPVNIPMNTIDLRFYENNSTTSLKNSVDEVLREYDIITGVSEGDIAIAINAIKSQYDNADTFQSRIYLANTQATTRNGYFLRGLDMTDNGLLKDIQSEINGYITQSSFIGGPMNISSVMGIPKLK